MSGSDSPPFCPTQPHRKYLALEAKIEEYEARVSALRSEAAARGAGDDPAMSAIRTAVGLGRSPLVGGERKKGGGNSHPLPLDTQATIKAKADQVAEAAGPGGLQTVAATAALGGAAALVLGGGLIGGAVVAGAAGYAATRGDSIGKTARAAGEGTIKWVCYGWLQ